MIPAQTRREPVAVADGVIEARHPGGEVIGVGAVAVEEIVPALWIGRGQVGQRHELEQVLGDRINPVGGHDVVRQRIAQKTSLTRRIGMRAERIVNLDSGFQQRGKIALPLGFGGNRAQERRGRSVPETFIGSEPEGAIAPVINLRDLYGTAGRKAPLVEWRRGFRTARAIVEPRIGAGARITMEVSFSIAAYSVNDFGRRIRLLPSSVNSVAPR